MIENWNEFLGMISKKATDHRTGGRTGVSTNRSEILTHNKSFGGTRKCRDKNRNQTDQSHNHQSFFHFSLRETLSGDPLPKKPNQPCRH